MNEICFQLAKLEQSRQIKLKFLKLDPKSLRLVVYADGSFMNQKGKTSQLGYAVCFTNASGAMSILQDIGNSGLIKSEVDLADDLTKISDNGALARAMQASYLDRKVEKYVLRGSL